MRRLVIAVALAALGLLMAAPAASAHALLASSSPGAGALLDQPPSSVVLNFTEAPDPALAVVHVLNSAGHAVEKGKPSTVPGQRNSLTVAVPQLSKGSYTVTWRTTSVVDGHTTGGSFAFGVGVKPTANATVRLPRTPRPSPLGVAGRFALYVGLALLLGAALLRALGYAASVTRVALAWAVAALGVAAMAVDFLRVSSAGVSRLVHTGAGRKVGLEVAAVALCGLAVLVLAAFRRRPSPWFLIAATAAVAMLARVWAGHAAASSVPNITVATQWVHVLTIGIWIGGLPWLVGALRATDGSERGAIASKFSFVAGLAVAVTVATGVARSIAEVGSWRGLFHTSFGVALLVKLAAVALLIGLGGINRFRNLRRATDNARSLARGVRVEIVVAAAVLAVTAVLTGLAPSTSVAASRRAPSGVTVTGSDFGTTMRAKLTTSPGQPGLNHFVVRVTDYDSGKLLKPMQVSLRLSLPSRPDIPAATVALTNVKGDWVADSAAVAIAGKWSATVVVQQAGGGTEIPLTFRTKQPAVHITEQRSAGVPTLYTITSAGREVQTYVDPGKRGFNEVHFTFLDATGAEVPTDLSAANAQRAGDPSIKLEFRRLDTGHFVADATLGRGLWHFSFTTSDGFSASFQQRI